MPSIKLTDQFGLNIDAQPAATSALLKYFQQLPSLKLDSLDLSKVGGLTLDQPALKSLTTGVSFQEPISLGAGAPALSISAGAQGSIKLITDGDDLPGEDKVELSKDSCYVCFGIEATASAGLSATSGVLKFGATPASKLDIASYSRLPLKTGITLLQAVQQTVSAFAVAGNCNDLADLPAGQITQAGVSGSLTLSGTANLLAATNPLASASLPAPLPAVSVSAGGSVTVGVSCKISAEYQVVARKLDSGAVRVGWYRKNGTQVTVQATAGEGITAGVGSGDLFSQLIAAISASPHADLKELAAAGVQDGQAADIQSAVKAAANRKLEIAVESEFTMSSSHSAAFLYEIDPAALTADSRGAVDQALRGDLTGLHAASGLAGVTCVRSVWDNVRKRELELDVNLLGILNYRSVVSLALEGKVLVEPATGALVISDTATAKRIQSEAVNFGADTQKLRHVLAESFLITAAYHSARQVASAAALRCSHSFFELQNSTSRAAMAHKLRTGVALNLLSGDEAELPVGVTNFGRTLFACSADYDDGLLEGMFLDAAGNPLPHEVYENAGRAAIRFLVQPGDVDEVRRRPAMEDALWNRMKDEGQPQFPNLLFGVPVPLVGAVTSDYTVIQWWADAMFQTAHQLAKVRLWLTRHPDAAVDNGEFQTLRQDLADYLRGVAANTRDEFGDPWGLIAMNQLAGRTAPARLTVTGPLLVRDKRRALVAGGIASPAE